MGPRRYPDSVYQAVVTAYFGRMLGAPDRLRIRAQTSYAIASTLAAGLLGAGLLGNLSAVSKNARFAGLGAFVVWILAAAAFIFATSAQTSVPEEDLNTEQEWLNAVLKNVDIESRSIQRRLHMANLLGATAIAATTLTLLVTVRSWSPEVGHPVRTVVSSDLAEAIAQACGGNADTIIDAALTTVGGSGSTVRLVIIGRPLPNCALFVPRASVLAATAR